MASLGVERFRLLASAIAGWLVDVAPAETGIRAWTDGVTVFVDADAGEADQLRYVAVQAALLGAGSLDPGVVGGLARRAALARRYLAVEGHRALALHEALLPRAVCSVIDPVVAARSDSPTTSLTIATGRERIADPPEIFGVIRPRQIRTNLSPAIDRRANEHVPRSLRKELLRELDDAETGDGPIVDFLSSPIGGGGAIGRLLKRMLGDARSHGSGPPGADAPTRWTRHGSRVSRIAALTTARASVSDDAVPVELRGTTYPEWDVFRRSYRPDWCTVIEPEPQAAIPLVPPDTHALRRALARLGMEVERRHRQLQGDDVDIDAAVDTYVEVVAGSAPEEAIYVDNVRGRRDLAVLLLLDISGSAGEPSATGVAVHEHQRAAAAALAMTLQGLGDRVALYAFRSMGRSAVHVVPVKRFGEGAGALFLRRIGGLVPGGYTRLGAAVRHGASVLEEEGGAGRRLLVVLSDGFAYDHGYEATYAEADTRRALAEARRRGTGCLCLSIGAATDPEDLRRVFGTAAHARIPWPEQLAGVVGPLFRAALRSAEVQRGSWQRRQRARERLQIARRTA